jgi:hypothetical protein
MLKLRSPYEGYAPSRAFDRPGTGDQPGMLPISTLQSAERRMATAISSFADDAARLKAPVWGAVAVDKSASFYASFARPDSETAKNSALDDCRKSSKAGNCQLVRMLFRTCFALARKSSDTLKWNGSIRDTPEAAKADAMAACEKAYGACKQSWLVCGDNRQ